MKKTISVNIGGLVYQIDEDAFNLLDNYLSNIKLHFSKDPGMSEIMSDMESRISDLFSEKICESKKVINIADVEEVITRLGKPEQIAGDEDDQEKVEDNKSNTSTGSYDNIHRKFYRDIDNQMLGGVCAGLAAYTGYDMTLLRLIAVLLVFVPFIHSAVIIVYILAWIIVPAARTAAQKLNMHGKDVTVENIGKTVTEGFNKVRDKADEFMKSDKPRTFAMRLMDGFVSAAAIIFKIILIILLVVCAPVLSCLFVALIALLVASVCALFGMGTGMIEFFNFGFDPLHVSLWADICSSILGLLIVGIPLFAFVYAIARHFFNWRSISNGWSIALSVIWLLSVVGGIFCFFFFWSSYITC